MCRQDWPARPCRIVSGPGLRRDALAWLIGEVASPWPPPRRTGCSPAGSRTRLRAAGASPGHALPFTDRVIVTLVHLRFQLPHAALAELYRVHRSTVTRAIGEVRPLLAARGFAVPGEPGIRLRTLADVFAYASARGVDAADRRHGSAGQAPPGEQAGTQGVRVGQEEDEHEESHRHHRREGPHPVGRARSGRAACTTRPRSAPRASPTFFSPVPAGQSQGRCRVPGAGQGIPGPGPGPAAKPKKNAPPEETAEYETQRHRQSSERICVEHANAEHKQWRHPPAVQRTTRALRRDLRRPSPAWSPTAPRNGNSSEPTRQASTPQR